MARTLFIDCAFGIGGDMLLAALCGLGLKTAPLQKALEEAGISATLGPRKENRQGIAGNTFSITWPDAQPLRHLKELSAIISRMPLSTSVQQKTISALTRLAEVEAAVHGIPLHEVHFHEVGAIDTLIDIAGAFWGMEQLGIHQVYSTPLPWFTGNICCEHGTLSLPAPATTKLLEGKPVYPTEFIGEMITPTGALIIDQMVQEFAKGPEGVLQKSSLGYGSRETGGGLRLFLMENTLESEKDDEVYAESEEAALEAFARKTGLPLDKLRDQLLNT